MINCIKKNFKPSYLQLLMLNSSIKKSFNLIIILFCFVSFLSCYSQKKKKYIIPSQSMLPYLALDRNKLDTTFDYNILEKSIFANLPDTVFGTKVKGTAEFWVVLDKFKVIKDINIISYEFFSNRKLIFKYEGENESSKKLKFVLMQIMKKEKLKQNKEAIGDELHLTYSFVTF